LQAIKKHQSWRKRKTTETLSENFFRLPQYALKNWRQKNLATKNRNTNAKKHPPRIAFLSIR